MAFHRYVLLLFLLPLSLRAQTVDSSRSKRPLRPDPARPATTTSGTTVPLSNQEMTQIVNTIGGGTNPGVMVRTVDNRYEGLRGTPYFLNDWSKGQVEMVDGKRYVDVPLKFDAFRQALILLRPTMGNDSIIINRQQVSQFQLKSADGQAYLFRRYPNLKAADADGSYFLVLYQGKTTLLKRIAKTFQGADYKQPYSTDIRYDSFQNKFDYYLLKPDQTLTKVKLSKKSLLDALADKRDGLKEFADKLSLKTEVDAAMLVQQYDSL